MKKRYPLLTALVALLVLGASAAIAATPTTLNYQGRLTNAGGTPVADGNYTVVFTIYDASVAGSSKWTEMQSVTTSGGLFSVLLGTISSITDTVFNGPTRYLGLNVAPGPELTPRTGFVTIPYANRVSTVDGSRGGSIIGNIVLENSSASAGNIYKGDSLFLHTYGTKNTFAGVNAGNLIMTGQSNTGTGRSALFSNTSGYDNTASGVSALMSNTTGYYNTASGRDALTSNTTGLTNTASGYSALYSNTAGNDNTASGYRALRSNTTGVENTASGVQALHFNTTGSWNTASGMQALYSNTTGSNNTAIGCYANVASGNLSNATAIGYSAVVNASNKIRLGNSAVTVIEGQVAYTFTSDKHQKENFQAIDGADVLRKIRELDISSWNYKGNDPKQFRHYGPTAQDFHSAFGNDGVGSCGDSTSINSGDLAGISLIAIQMLEREKELLKATVESVKSENAALKSRLDAIEAMLKGQKLDTRERSM